MSLLCDTNERTEDIKSWSSESCVILHDPRQSPICVAINQFLSFSFLLQNGGNDTSHTFISVLFQNEVGVFILKVMKCCLEMLYTQIKASNILIVTLPHIT